MVENAWDCHVRVKSVSRVEREINGCLAVMGRWYMRYLLYITEAHEGDTDS